MYDIFYIAPKKKTKHNIMVATKISKFKILEMEGFLPR